MRLSLAAVLSVSVFAAALAAGTVPVPQPRPVRPAEKLEGAPDARLSSCEADLAKTGAAFKQAPPESVAIPQCSVASPVEISKLPGGVELEPPALLDCPTALKFSQFVTQAIQPIAAKELGSPVGQIRQDSAFVCRARNGTSKLSEHAFGRAIDIASFTTATGLVVPVMAMPKDREIEASFLTAIRNAACGPFATVLGPGSDADHATHFHFDLAPRKGGAYCR